ERLMKWIILLPTLLLGMCAPVVAQDKGSGVNVGLLAGGHWLTRGETRDAFGDVWPNLSLELFWHHQGRPERLTVDVSGRWGHSDGDAPLVPVAFGWWQDLADLVGDDDEQKSWRTYVAARVGPYYGDVRNRLTGDNESTVGFNGQLVLGGLFGQRF